MAVAVEGGREVWQQESTHCQLESAGDGGGGGGLARARGWAELSGLQSEMFMVLRGREQDGGGGRASGVV